MSNDEFTEVITNFQLDPTKHKEELAALFITLAKNIVRSFQFENLDVEDAVQECVFMGFVKINNYRADRGKAFNFFTTVFLNHCRYLYRLEKNYSVLKSKFFKHLYPDAKTTR